MDTNPWVGGLDSYRRSGSIVYGTSGNTTTLMSGSNLPSYYREEAMSTSSIQDKYMIKTLV